MSDCGWCGAPNTHYMTHVCPGCTCHHIEVGIPGEPQVGTYLETEPNPDCPVHFGDAGSGAACPTCGKREQGVRVVTDCGFPGPHPDVWIARRPFSRIAEALDVESGDDMDAATRRRFA